MFRQLLEKLALALDARRIDYMIIGGQAVLLYGEPRLTKDIDVTLGTGPERLEDVLGMVGELGWTPLAKEPAAFVRGTMVLPCEDSETGIRIDFIFSSSPYEQQAMRRAQRVPTGRAEVRYASLEDLIIHKVIAGRPKDLEDVRALLLKNRSADEEYIRDWLAQFETALDQPVLQVFEGLWRETSTQGGAGAADWA